jgi:hypothetical protein
MHAKVKPYGATAVKFPSSSNLTSALCSKRWHKKIREGLRRIADSTGPLETRFSLSVFQLFKFCLGAIYTSFRFRSPGSPAPAIQSSLPPIPRVAQAVIDDVENEQRIGENPLPPQFAARGAMLFVAYGQDTECSRPRLLEGRR